MQRRLVYFLVLVLPPGCKQIPDGAKVEKTGWLLTDEKLELPWVAMSPVEKKWCFAHLGFTASEAQVLLEVRAGAPFNQRRAGGAVSLELTNPSGHSVYRAEGSRRDPCCSETVEERGRWVSEYDLTTLGPSQDTKYFYEDNTSLKAKIGNNGKYCAVLNITQASASLGGGQVRVVLQSG